jgi:hypothetical protein
MTPSPEQGATRAELYVRERLPRPAQHRRAELMRALSTLVANGTIGAVDETEWPAKVPREERTETRQQYDAFSSWARKAGTRLNPSFDTRECYSMTTGERSTWLVLPTLCLAVYGDEGLQAVYPHADGTDHYTVMDGLARLRGTERDGNHSAGTAALEPAD